MYYASNTQRADGIALNATSDQAQRKPEQSGMAHGQGVISSVLLTRPLQAGRSSSFTPAVRDGRTKYNSFSVHSIGSAGNNLRFERHSFVTRCGLQRRHSKRLRYQIV